MADERERERGARESVLSIYVDEDDAYMSYLCLSFCLFSVSGSIDILMLILDLDEWGCN